MRDTDSDNCGCGNCAASDKKLEAALNEVCAPYDLAKTSWQNYEVYRNFCRWHDLLYFDYSVWLAIDEQPGRNNDGKD